MAVNGSALAAIGIGSIFVWSGIKGWSVMGTVADLVTGKEPTQTNANPLIDPNYVAPIPGDSGNLNPNVNPGVFQGGIAGIATQYQGHPYAFGGAPGKDGQRPWDCSSFVNFVIGLRLGGSIPGYSAGQYDGISHGPPTGLWAVWPGLTRINAGDVQAGDIIVWATHMGIAISNTQMISALNEREGTKIGNISGSAPGPILTYGRYHG